MRTLTAADAGCGGNVPRSDAGYGTRDAREEAELSPEVPPSYY